MTGGSKAAMWLELGFTQRTRWLDTRPGGGPGNEGRWWFSGAFTPRCIPKSRMREAGRTQWFEVMDGGLKHIYEAGHVQGGQFQPARWDLMPPRSYM
jgi:hypothetical protein